MRLFDNAESVMINNKEVQSIIDSNGGVLYEKVSPQSPYVLTVTSDKDILSYYDEESATLTATLTHNGVPVEGEKIQFISTNSIEKEIHDSGNYSEIGRYFEVDLSNLPVGQHYNIGGDDSISSKISLHKYQNGTNVFVGNSGEGIVQNDIVYFEDTQLRYINSTNGKEIIKDISNYDLSIWNKFSVDLSGDVLVKYPVFYRSGVTDVNGQCNVTYDSKGIGDVSINVECMNLQETYSIEDCSRVYPNTYTSQSNLNYALPSTPFEVAFTLTRQSGVGYVRIGTDTNNCILFGQVGNDGSNGIARMNNGSYSNLIQSNITPPVNAPISIKCQFDGTTYKYSIGDDTISYNDVGQALTTLILIYCTNGNSIKNLRIKPL